MAHLLRHGGKKELHQDFGLLGAPPQEMLDAIEQADEFEIWPENVEPLALFQTLGTQWHHGHAGPIGMNYPGVLAALQFMRVEPTPELFEQIQTMERAALEALREGKNGD